MSIRAVPPPPTKFGAPAVQMSASRPANSMLQPGGIRASSPRAMAQPGQIGAIPSPPWMPRPVVLPPVPSTIIQPKPPKSDKQKKQAARNKWQKIHNKRKCSDWQYALLHYGMYGLSREQMDKLIEARDRGLGLPADIGHLRGRPGKPDNHVTSYITGYVYYIVDGHGT